MAKPTILAKKSHSLMRRGLFLASIVVWLLAACTPAPNLRDELLLADTSLVSGEPCAAPCWQELTPGETAWGVAQAHIEETQDYRQTDSDTDRRTGEAWIEFAYRDGPTCCRIYTTDGETLSAIFLLVAPDMLLSDVIARYGEPTYMTAEAQTSDQAQVALVYPDPTLAMIVYAFAPNITTAEINADSEIIAHVYMAASEMETLLASENLYAWDGYSLLGDVIDGIFDLTPAPLAEQTAEP